MGKLINLQDGSFTGNKELAKYLAKNQTLAGVFWFSKLQWTELRDKKKDRTYCRLKDKRVEEYTEFIDFDMLADDPNAACLYPDAICLGVGVFDHWSKSL